MGLVSRSTRHSERFRVEWESSRLQGSCILSIAFAIMGTFFRYTLCRKEHMVVSQNKGTPPSYTGLLLIGTHPKRDP